MVAVLKVAASTGRTWASLRETCLPARVQSISPSAEKLWIHPAKLISVFYETAQDTITVLYINSCFSMVRWNCWHAVYSSKMWNNFYCSREIFWFLLTNRTVVEITTYLKTTPSLGLWLASWVPDEFRHYAFQIQCGFLKSSKPRGWEGKR